MTTIAQPTMEKVNQLKTNEELLINVAKYMVELAALEVLKPVIEKIYNDILKKYDFQEVDRHDNKIGRIDNYKRLYRSDDDTSEFYKEVGQALFDKGYGANCLEGYCPLCIQEHKVNKLKWAITDTIKEVYEWNSVYMSMENENKLFELNLRFLGPLVTDDIKEALQQVGA